MKSAGFLIVIALLLPGCATPEERAARAKAEMEEMIRVYGPACEKLGYARDSDLWRDCILRLSSRAYYRAQPTTTTCTGSSGFLNCYSY